MLVRKDCQAIIRAVVGLARSLRIKTVIEGIETKEQLAGYYIIDVPDADTALSWAAKCPGASYGAMEVRPIVMMS